MIDLAVEVGVAVPLLELLVAQIGAGPGTVFDMDDVVVVGGEHGEVVLDGDEFVA